MLILGSSWGAEGGKSGFTRACQDIIRGDNLDPVEYLYQKLD